MTFPLSTPAPEALVRGGADDVVVLDELVGEVVILDEVVGDEVVVFDELADADVVRVVGADVDEGASVVAVPASTALDRPGGIAAWAAVRAVSLPQPAAATAAT